MRRGAVGGTSMALFQMSAKPDKLGERTHDSFGLILRAQWLVSKSVGSYTDARRVNGGCFNERRRTNQLKISEALIPRFVTGLGNNWDVY